MANPRAVRFLKEITTQLRPCLIFLSETLVGKNKIEEICKGIHYSGCFTVDAQGLGGGLALIWKNEGGVEIKGSCNHYIDCEVKCDQIGRWRYTGFYSCPERYRRRESWSILKHLASQSQLLWCILGDFNDIMFAHEKNGGRPHPSVLLEGFSNTVNECGLIEISSSGSAYTWERSRGTVRWIQEKLDRGLANHEWRNMFSTAEVRVLEVSTSDHLPLYLELNRTMYTPKVRCFKFENVWIREDECKKVIQESWGYVEGRSIMEKMEYCCLKLEEWGGGKVKEMRLQIQECINNMKKFRSRRDGYGVTKYNEAREEFLKLLEKQEVYWKQRSKQFWLREGDHNTKFFHKFALGRRKRNQVTKLKDSNGEWKEDKDGVRKVIIDYFSELFQSSGVNAELSERDTVKRITEEQNNDLCYF
ncbi:uncharacterized protein LOC141711250 [Apium graveolens]|uniref:uncharacterized protein LOC141711250 n=1 Tax=Apium graveolens TaxID=4045 RepID=UPI003D7B307C